MDESPDSLRPTDLALDCGVLNDLTEGLPFEIVSAELGKIRIDIPIADLWNGSCSLTIDGLLIKVTPLIDTHKNQLLLRGKSWLYELATSVSLENEKNNINNDNNVELYRGLHKVQFYHHNIQTKQVIEEEKSSTQFSEMQPILHNLKININNTIFIITHQSPFDKNYNSILKIQSTELSVSNIEEMIEEETGEEKDNIIYENAELTKRISFCGAGVESLISYNNDKKSFNLI